MTNEDILFAKERLSFWYHLNEMKQNMLLNNMSVVHYEKGTIIHNGNQDCIGVLLVASGCIRSSMVSAEGKEVTLYRLYTGDVCVLSASCLMRNITFDVTISAEEDSKIILINSKYFAKLIEENIYVKNFTYELTNEKFSDVMWAMEQILFMSFDKRLAIFLLDECSKENTDTLYLTQEQIAKYMGSAREVVSRMLRYFQNEGLVQVNRGEVQILDKKALKKITM